MSVDQLKKTVRMIAEGTSPSASAFENAKSVIGPYVELARPTKHPIFITTLDAWIKAIEDREEDDRDVLMI